MTPLCDFPHSSSSSSVVAPTRRPPLRTAGATATSTSTARPGAAAAIFLVLLAIVVGRADACDIGLINSYNVTLHLVTYDDWDDTCVTPFNSYKVSKNGGGTPGRSDSSVPLLRRGSIPSPRWTDCIHLKLPPHISIFLLILLPRYAGGVLLHYRVQSQAVRGGQRR
jgi:hypothetical protein